tara:strand:- start:13912 stop:14079 length:168 start_codon:yes stop_codon:yes gene_type:complete
MTEIILLAEVVATLTLFLHSRRHVAFSALRNASILSSFSDAVVVSRLFFARADWH